MTKRADAHPKPEKLVSTSHSRQAAAPLKPASKSVLHDGLDDGLAGTLDRDAIAASNDQDPHALGGARDNMLEVAIGREVRSFRKKLGITVADLARVTGLSLGMLSKIENGVTSASLTTLQRLSRALGVPVTAPVPALRRAARCGVCERRPRFGH